MGGNIKLIKFKSFCLQEGGNVHVGDVLAQQITSKVNRTKLVNDLIKNLLILNNQFQKEYGLKIWKNESYLKSGEVFSGSSEHFINLNISDEEYLKHKPKTGDIDIQIDKSLETNLHDFFKKHNKFGTMEYLGQSQTAIGQISSLFKIDGYMEKSEKKRRLVKKKILIQLDFEFVDVDEKGKPTEWSKFSRSSNWSDIENGIKGVFHKFALANIDHVFTKKIKIKKGKRNPKIIEQEIHFFAFSVQNGLRPKYRPVPNEKDVWEAIPSKEGNYTQDISQIFETLFRKKPGKTDRDLFNSFVGIIELVKKYFNKKQQQKFVNAFVEFIWGKNAQKLYRGNPLQDAEVKNAAMNYIEKKLKIKKSKYDSIINNYYKNY